MAIWTFWLPAAALTLLALGLAALGLMRGARAAAAPGERRELRIYADQLREIERERARGLIAPDEAERLRLETARRLLDADRALAGQRAGQAPRGMRALGLALIVLAAGAAALVYWREGAPLYPDQPLALRHAAAEDLRANRAGQEELAAAWAASPLRESDPEPDPEFLALMEQLRSALASRPLDITGFRLLAQNEARLGRFSEAAQAQGHVVRLLQPGAAEEVAERIRHAQFLIAAAGGLVSPEAEDELEAILRRDPQNGFARFFVGVMFEQTGRPDLTFQIWRRLLDDSPPDAPWVADLRAGLEPLAAIAGVRYTLPPESAAGQRGPSAEDIEAAADLDPEARAAMIGGMVEGLSARLAAQGGPPADWARLIRSLAILGQADRARAIWTEAQLVFADDPAALAEIAAGAEAGGLAP